MGISAIRSHLAAGPRFQIQNLWSQVHPQPLHSWPVGAGEAPPNLAHVSKGEQGSAYDLGGQGLSDTIWESLGDEADDLRLSHSQPRSPISCLFACMLSAS